MESAVEALKMAFGVLVFVIALSVTISMFSLARQTADVVLGVADDTTHYEYYENNSSANAKGNRIVGLETIIPTMYKYNKENYTIQFKKGSVDGDDFEICNGISKLDLDEERQNNEPWIVNNEQVKKHLDAMINGGEYTFSDGSNKSENYGQGVLENLKGKKFEEHIGKQVAEETNMNKTTSKTIITYVKID